MAQESKHRYTIEEYFAMEAAAAETRHEYHDGEVFAMSGGTFNHSAITANMTGILYTQLAGKGCRPLSSDLRIQIKAAQLYTYPDLSAVCGDPEFYPGRRDTITNPSLIIEVLSDSTEGYDRGKKFLLYRTLPSLQHYLLISQHEIQVEYYERKGDFWALRTYTDLTDSIPITLPGGTATISLAAIYQDIEFMPEETP